MAVAFCSSAEEALHRNLGFSAKQKSNDQFGEDINECFELERCAKWISDHSFRRIALQFPDEQLSQSVRIAQKLGSMVPDSKLYILGDTSFGSCCVDEVAAEHSACEGVIHFGHSCLSPPSRLATLFVLGMYPREWTSLGRQAYRIRSTPEPSLICISQDPENHSQREEEREEFLVIVDTEYCSQLDAIRAHLPSRAVIGVPLIPGNEEPAMIGQQALKRLFPTSRLLTEFGLVLWIGKEGQALVNVLLRFSFASVWAYDPEHNTLQQQGLTISRSLMRRRFLVEKAKDARTIGILIGTLGVQNYLQVIGHLRQLIRKAGRKSYTLAVGKLNVAKLANFQEIDVYVYVACPENSFFDSKEFYRPVVTPYELEVALNPNRTWGAHFSTDFNDILPGGPAYVATPEDMESSLNYETSLISGKARCLLSDLGEVLIPT
ncbi:2-(3-amino-3-carboxypropyl)histidine synthase subunit 2-like isoform X2 [Varroa destructor]|uniref:2-(3-amino-3-carboxypropyl)histidine synthase subunit 2 n=1 Tax=Varroa destructor TaxID=109461 RepID=A0A7M7K0E1_VARDE|nr:2-(3-amino-3-carboxypropyl)histidine synthase subunit 2-like isoform X2 [Varroa destructor]